jgi:hypothetical protein
MVWLITKGGGISPSFGPLVSAVANDLYAIAHDTVTAIKSRIVSFPAALEAQAFGYARHLTSARLHLQVHFKPGFHDELKFA